jgi:hypothetical protein
MRNAICLALASLYHSSQWDLYRKSKRPAA